MKRWISLLLIFSLLLLPACKKVSKEWTEQYELGNKYLSDGNYEEAILAFSAAIDVDPNQPDAYVGRGDAHIGRATHLAKDGIKLRTEQSQQVIECLQSAQSDYQKATDLAAEGYKMTTDPEVLTAKLAQTTERLTQVETAEAEAIAAESAPSAEAAEETAAASSLEFEMREEYIEFRVSDGTLYYSNTINYPYFLGDSAVEATLNQFYAAEIEEFRNTDRNFEDEYREAVTNNYMHTDGLFDNLFAEVTYNKNGAISVRHIFTMWAGGAHPYQGHTGKTHRIDTGAELTLRDVLIGSDAQILDAITSTPAYSEVARMYSDPSFMLEVPWILNEEGLCFMLEVGAALPRLEIVIPYTSPDTYVIDLTGGQTAAAQSTGGVVTVEDAFADSVYFANEDHTCTYAIPRILLDGQPLEQVNSQIYREFYDERLAPSGYDSGTYPQGLSYIAYSWGETEEIASVLVARGEVLYYDWCGYEVYTVSKTTGQQLTTSEILEAVGMSEKKFYAMLTEIIEEGFAAQRESLQETFASNPSLMTQFDQCLADSIAQSNLENAIPYIDASGDLCVIATMYTFAGAGRYSGLLNLTGDAVPVNPM